MISFDDLMTTRQAAEFLGVSPVRVRQFYQDGRIRGRNFAGSLVFMREDLRSFAKIPRRIGAAGHREKK